MKLFQIQYFCAACEQGSITRAAELLHVSQPSVSTAIHALEEEFGCRLIGHSSRGFQLTEEGRYFYRQASRILTSSHELARDMNIMGSKSGTVAIGASPMAAGRSLPYIYQALPEEGPGSVHLNILECGGADILDMLRNGRLDFALIPVDDIIGGFYEVREIGQFQVVLAVPPGHPLASRDCVTVEELSRELFVYFDEDGIFSRRVNQVFEAGRVRPRILCITSQVYTVRKFVAHGVALSFLFEGIAREAPDICGVPLDPPIRIRLGLIWRKGEPLRPAAELFLKHMENFSYSTDA